MVFRISALFEILNSGAILHLELSLVSQMEEASKIFLVISHTWVDLNGSKSVQRSSHISRRWHATSHRNLRKTQRTPPGPSGAPQINLQIFNLTKRNASHTTET